MTNKTNKITEEKQHVDKTAINVPNKKPDELTGLNIEAKFKIFDPETGKVIAQGRA